MRKLIGITSALSTALLTFAFTRATLRKQAKGIEWDLRMFNGETGESLTFDEAILLAEAGAQANDEPAPMFYEGDDVILYNPYSAEFYATEYGFAPAIFTISDVKFDEDQGVFRYRLKEGEPNDWYSEDWISLQSESTFIRNWTAVERSGVAQGHTPELTPEMAKAESAILDKALDDAVRKRQIDACLDTLTYGNAEERAEAERVLTALTAKKKEAKE